MPLFIPHDDASFAAKLAPSLGYFKCKFLAKKFDLLPMLLSYCRLNSVKKVIISSVFNPVYEQVFGELEGTDEDNWGTYLILNDIEFIVIPNLRSAYSYPYGEFLIDHYCQKLAFPHLFPKKDVFRFDYLDFENLDEVLKVADSAMYCAVDIETYGKADESLITSVAYTFMLFEDGKFKTKTWALRPELSNIDAFFYCLKVLNKHPVHKVFQNGQYDNAYFLRFGVPVINWSFDTMTLAHSIYCELPKSLHFASGLYLLDYKYWKDDNKKNLYEYNAKDTHNTAWLLLAQLQYIQRLKLNYALDNFLIKFPMNYPFLHGGMQGLMIDLAKREELKQIEVAKAEALLEEIRYLLDWPDFNPASPVQSLAILNGLGKYLGKTFKSSDKANMNAFAETHPFWEFIKTKIVAYRKATKAISTYYECSLFNDRLMYSQNPCGTETGRASSKSSYFWCGTQVQNMPPYAKPMVVADEGWLFFEIDKAQAESRCTAYLSQDLTLIDTVENSPDFHCTNASLFFGIPFDELFQQEYFDQDGTYYKAKVKRPDIRKLAKPINHGFNYNMGAYMLITIMGVKAILQAAKVLGVSRQMPIDKIASLLLDSVDRAYPKIKGTWYQEVIYEVLATGKLRGATGYTRRTFLNPKKIKSHLNKVVAHHPQSLSALKVDKAILAWWKTLIVKPRNNIKFLAQIHDSIFGKYKVGHEAEVHKLAEIMEGVTVIIHGRELKIPVDVNLGATNWGGLK